MASPGNFSAMLYFCEVNAAGQKLSGYRHPGEAYPFNFSFPKELRSIMGLSTEMDNLVIGTVEKSGEPSGSASYHDISAENVAEALNATMTTETKTEQVITSTEFTFGKFGDFEELGFEQLAADPVIKNQAGDVTYNNFDNDPAIGDYKIDLVSGLIMPLSSGNIVEDSTGTITGSVPAVTQSVVDMKKVASKFYRIKGSIRNRVTKVETPIKLYCVRMVSAATVGASSESSDTDEQLDFNLIPQIPVGGNSYGIWKGLPMRAGV